MPPPLTLSDIALRAGVSRMTVSLALRNDPRTARATRERIQQLAREMNYRPSPLISTLMTSVRLKRNAARKTVIAFVADQRSGREPTFRQYLQGARARATELGFKLDLFTYGAGQMTTQRLDSILYARGVVGVIVAPLFEPGKALEIDWQRYAVTALGYSMRSPGLHRVVNHQFQSITAALDRLSALGYRRPGLALNKPDDERVFHNWVAGYLTQGYLHAARAYPPPFITDQWNRTAFGRWFKKHRPDVVVALKGDVLPWIEACGAKVPQRVGFAILNWEPESGTIAGIDQNSLGVGAGAVDVTVAQLHANERGTVASPKITLIEGRWRDGHTVRNLRT